MNVDFMRWFLLWCSVINYAVLLSWVLLVLLWRDGMYRLWGRRFRLSPEQFDVLNTSGISLYKIGIILFNLVPCIASYLVG
jgi:hypothetical protein